jgi:hypothetical protein
MTRLGTGLAVATASAGLLLTLLIARAGRPAGRADGVSQVIGTRGAGRAS